MALHVTLIGILTNLFTSYGEKNEKVVRRKQNQSLQFCRFTDTSLKP